VLRRPFRLLIEDLTIKWRRQILQSEAESQRIAVRKLLNRLQHPGVTLPNARSPHMQCSRTESSVDDLRTSQSLSGSQ